ncbi:hypothetical protein INT45_008634 [Circinella minor]|uniref:Uncharacterized protein n=1 Tax=Circinella minor TaxID=1195481 RepID=A0A8H7S442_9FUNG|nr:hypothetical protein INT45_008634 [Circinella minor]
MTTTTEDMMTMMNDKKEAEQRYKDDLIEKATKRLRRRLLEEQLSKVMQSIIQMQSQLEFLRVDASATMDAVTNIQQDEHYSRLESLERRLNDHQKQLNQLAKQTVETTTTTEQDDKDHDNTVAVDMPHHLQQQQQRQQEKPQTFSMSRLSSLSLMSSLFSRTGSSNNTPATSRAASDAASSCYNDNGNSEDVNDDCMSVASSMMSDTPEERQRRHRRRSRVKHHRQAQMMRTDDVTELKWNQKAPTLFPLPEQRTTTTTTATINPSHHHDNTMHYLGNNKNNNYSNNDDDDDDDDDILSDIGSMSTASTMSNPRAIYDMLDHHREFLKNNLSSYQGDSDDDDDVDNPRHQENQIQCFNKQDTVTYTKNGRPRHPLSPLSQNFYLEGKSSFFSEKGGNLSDYYEFDCDVLDDALSFLDNMSVDDGGFGEDMEFLLGHPDLCYGPLNEILGKKTVTGSHHKEQQCTKKQSRYYHVQPKVTIPTALYHYGMSWMSSMGYSACLKSVRWCKFLSILFAAMMVSVLKGPQDILDVY